MKSLQGLIFYIWTKTSNFNFLARRLMKQVYHIIKNKTKQASKGNKNTRHLQLKVKIKISVNTYMKPKSLTLKGTLLYDSIFFFFFLRNAFKYFGFIFNSNILQAASQSNCLSPVNSNTNVSYFNCYTLGNAHFNITNIDISPYLLH